MCVCESSVMSKRFCVIDRDGNVAVCVRLAIKTFCQRESPVKNELCHRNSKGANGLPCFL